MINRGIILTTALMVLPLAATGSHPAPETAFSERCTISATSGCDGDWTTLTAGNDYLREVDALSDRATLHRYGTSGEGRPLYSFEVGDHSNPVMLVVCSQHGREPAPRESCLRKAGELALSDDRRVLDLLATIRFVFVPTANPDGRAHNLRGLKDLADPNRHHADLKYPEDRGIANLLDQYQPIAAMDTHEMDPRFHYDIALSEPKDPDVDPAIHDLSSDIMAALADHFADESPFTTGTYEIPKTSPQVLGNQFGLRFAVGGLVETRMSASRGQRVWMQDEAFDVVAGYVEANVAKIEQVESEARQRSALPGLVPPDVVPPGAELPDDELTDDELTDDEGFVDEVAPPEVPEANKTPEADKIPEPNKAEAATPETPTPTPTPRSSEHPQATAPTPTASEGATRNIEAQDSTSALVLLFIAILAAITVLALASVVFLRRRSDRNT